MFRKVILLSAIVALAALGASLRGDESKPKFTPLNNKTVLEAPSQSVSRSACTFKKHDDTALGFYSGFVTGDRIVTYFDLVAECGGSAYPFEIQTLSFTLIAPSVSYKWPIDIDIVVYERAGADSCFGPGLELCRFTVTCDSADFRLPHIGTATFPSACCVTEPVFIGIEYSDNGAGQFPSVVFDDSPPVPECDNWAFGLGTWSEWYDFWGPPQPGYPIYWVDGETQSSVCGPKILIDEVRTWSGSTGLGDSLVSFVDISNTGFDQQNLSGWSINGTDGSESISLPSWTIPDGTYLRVEFGPGTNDADFSDGIATFYAGSTSWQFDRSTGEVGLYDGATIVDFVAWGEGTSSFGSSYTDALGEGIWNSGDFVELGGSALMDLLTRTPSGYDSNDPLDWRMHERHSGNFINYHNSIQLSPRNTSVSDTIPLLVWSSVGDGSSSYLVQIDDDSLFTLPEISIQTNDTSYSPNLIENTYFWRVIPAISGGPYPAAVWSFSYEEVGARPGGSAGRTITDDGYAPVPQRFQHKDSRLLCIWNLKNSTRPGCTETAGAQGPWDAEHPQGNHILSCQHCHMYCTRASIQMVNAKLGGTLTKDEITYHMKENNVAGPEGDLGHDVGAWPQEDATYSWALNGAAISENIQAAAAIPWATLKAEIDAGRPVLVVLQNPFHTVVFDSYYETDTGRRRIYISDPWPGKSGWYDHATTNVLRYYTYAAGATGRLTDPNVALDSDGDGIVDFDEQRPSAGSGQTARTFHCVHNDKDTDDDQVEDKAEIRNYTFHDQAGYHPGHENNSLTFPDVDGDGARAENDCDSDNDSDFDGGEDINGDGNNPVPSAGGVCTRETCQFDNTEFCISVAVNKDTYLLGEPVYIVDYHFSRQTHTYHANSTYNYEKGPLCPIKADGSGLGHNGSFTTDAGGHARQTLVEYCLSPGIKYLTVDVLDDNLYSTPDNLDPQTCWECLADWFHGFHYAYDYPYHNVGVTYPNYTFPVTCVREGSNPSVVTYVIEVPWWWWCYVWPPVIDRYWLAIQIDRALLDNNIITFSQPPSFVPGSPQDCNQPPFQLMNFDEQLTFELEGTSPDPEKQWLAFSTQQWQLPDSLISTRIELDVAVGTKFASTPYVKIMAGDSVFGWSPTPYDSIPITIISSCCIGSRGDVNGDGIDANILDLTYAVDRIFRGGPAAPCPEEGDINSDGAPTNILDLTFLVDRIFRGGPAPGSC